MPQRYLNAVLLLEDAQGVSSSNGLLVVVTNAIMVTRDLLEGLNSQAPELFPPMLYHVASYRMWIALRLDTIANVRMQNVLLTYVRSGFMVDSTGSGYGTSQIFNICNLPSSSSVPSSYLARQPHSR